MPPAERVVPAETYQKFFCDNYSLVIDSMNIDFALLATLQSEQIISMYEVEHIRSIPSEKRLERGLQFLHILMTDSMRFGTSSKIDTLIGIFRNELHPRPAMAELFINLGKLLPPVVLIQPDQPDLIPSVRSIYECD